MNKTEQQAIFSRPLLEWYRRSKRRLPWRETKDPYAIWISEVMLQQTRVETVIPYYQRFMEKFPTVEALAGAPEEEVLKAWEGLGYYSRARNLQAAVREVHERYGGVVPAEPEAIASLKGVGPYTAGAILSIAYNRPEPAVDGNVMRVLSRFFLIEEDIAKGKTRKFIEDLARRLIPAGEAGDFNQALMELGATVCTPRSPHCLTCPVLRDCAARLAGREESLPVKTKAKPPRPERRVAALIYGAGDWRGRFLIRQRPAEGLLARMWELPHYEAPAARMPDAGSSPEEGGAASTGAAAGGAADIRASRAAEDGRNMRFLRERIAEEEGLTVEPLGWLLDAEHTFSHLRWELNVYLCEASAAVPPFAPLPAGCRWIGWDELGNYAFPNVFRKILRAAAPEDSRTAVRRPRKREGVEQ
jgi:A/G-specific adenine glycosylase